MHIVKYINNSKTHYYIIILICLYYRSKANSQIWPSTYVCMEISPKKKWCLLVDGSCPDDLTACSAICTMSCNARYFQSAHCNVCSWQKVSLKVFAANEETIIL